MLEPYDGKLSRTVLRREGGGNTADPADWNGAKSASCAWELFGDAPLPSQPPANDSGYLTGRIGYHRRTGGHDITRWDWAMFLRFLDFHNG